MRRVDPSVRRTHVCMPCMFTLAAIPPSVQSALAANPRDPAAMAEAAKVLKDNPEMLKVAADMFEKLSPGEEGRRPKQVLIEWE